MKGNIWNGIFFEGEKKNGKGKWGKYWKKENILHNTEEKKTNEENEETFWMKISIIMWKRKSGTHGP